MTVSIMYSLCMVETTGLEITCSNWLFVPFLLKTSQDHLQNSPTRAHAAHSQCVHFAERGHQPLPKSVKARLLQKDLHEVGDLRLPSVQNPFQILLVEDR